MLSLCLKSVRYATICYAASLLSISCASQGPVSKTSEATYSSDAKQIIATQSVDKKLQATVHSESDKYLCYGLAADQTHAIWIARSEEACDAALGYIKNSLSFERVVNYGTSDQDNVIMRLMLGKLAVGETVFDSSPIGGFTITQLCTGAYARICKLDLRSQTASIEIKDGIGAAATSQKPETTEEALKLVEEGKEVTIEGRLAKFAIYTTNGDGRGTAISTDGKISLDFSVIGWPSDCPRTEYDIKSDSVYDLLTKKRPALIRIKKMKCIDYEGRKFEVVAATLIKEK